VGARYDVIVIGSGFGGAIAAARLAEKGARVLVLERGRRWTKDQYPRALTDPWIYSHTRPQKRNGWFDLRFFRKMTVVQGAGVGGSSLCYSAVVIEPDPDLFDRSWPPEITRDELRPYYANVAAMLKVRTIPSGQRTARGRLLRRAAEALGQQARFSDVPLAIAFDDGWTYGLEDPLHPRHSRAHVNEHGQRQGTCIHLGNCDVGCDVEAKNSLDFNYIPFAERHGAEIRPLHVVRDIQPESGHYRVVFDRIEKGRLIPGSESATRIVLAAGSLGTTELLLRCRDRHRSLPRVSRRLGQGWSANGNVLTPDRYRNTGEVRQGIGPSISTRLSFMDGSVNGQRFTIEDDGFPNLWSLLRRRPIRRALDERNPAQQWAMWLGIGVDAADGELRLRRPILAPWATRLDLHWRVDSSRPLVEAILGQQAALSAAAGGRLLVPWYWRLAKGLMTVHPLGGCAMGRTEATGVVDHTGAVFGHPNLYVCDGSILPAAVGRNPSMTIGALAERIAALMADD